jgi:hypothetical protein
MPRMTRECTIQDLPPEYAAQIGELLEGDEHVLACFESSNQAGTTTRILNEIVLQDNESRDFHLAYVVTPKQLIVAGTDYWPSPFVQAMRLADIITVTDVQPFLAGFAIIVHGPDERHFMCRFARKEEAMQFARVLAGAIAGGKGA